LIHFNKVFAGSDIGLPQIEDDVWLERHIAGQEAEFFQLPSLTEVLAPQQGHASRNCLLECTASRLARLCFGALKFFEPC